MRRMVLPLVGLLAVLGCGGGEDDGSLVADQLALVPAAAIDGDSWQIVLTDLARLADLSGLAPPDAGRSGQDLAVWTGQMTFAPTDVSNGTPIGFLPSPLGGFAAWTSADDIRAATGVALGGVDTIVTVDAPPSSFTVMQGDVELADSLTDVGDGVVSYGDGDDFSIGQPTDWNQIGAPIRFAVSDDSIAWSRSTSLAAEFAAGAESTLADDDDLAVLAAAFDARDVVSAFIVGNDFTANQGFPTPAVDPFTIAGVGVTVIDGEARTIVAYVFADDDAAASAVDPLTDAWSSGQDTNGREIGEMFAVLSSSAEGRVALVELVPVGTESTQGPARLLVTRSSVFTHP